LFFYFDCDWFGFSFIWDLKMKIDEAVELLEEWSSYDGTEVGDTWQSMTLLWSNRDYISPDFLDKLEKEIIYQAECAKSTMEIHTEEVTIKRERTTLRRKK